MLKHLKMKQQLDRRNIESQQASNNWHVFLAQQHQQQHQPNPSNLIEPTTKEAITENTQRTSNISASQLASTKSCEQKPKRVRGRRSSKPLMEKRRRARINECLDILKTYVLTDSNNLSHLGVDMVARENQDEEAIARTILKSSGLINRHRGRKNPNKLEKADILELTVDYVRRLHDQRDQLLNDSNNVYCNSFNNKYNLIPKELPASKLASSTSPLSLNIIESQQKLRAITTVPPTPSPSSASSSPQPLLSISSNIHYQGSNGVLDLSDSSRKKACYSQETGLLYMVEGFNNQQALFNSDYHNLSPTYKLDK